MLYLRDNNNLLKKYYIMKKLFFIFSLVCVLGCKDQKTNTPKTNEEPQKTETTQPIKSNKVIYASASDDDQMAANIKNFLTLDYLKNDLSLMTENDRKFQFYKVDINGDKKDEYFVNLMSPYFCGTGGCTVVLLDHESNVINRFTVMETPIYLENNKTNKWKNILVFSKGKLKVLEYKNGKYPSNPSVVSDAPYDAPSGHAIVMFDENFAKPKTYTF